MLKVIETFTSLQGESTQAGRRCFFIRLSGCNLNCNYCDTGYARSGGRDESVETLLETARRSGCRLVEVTGGEPLAQGDTPELCRRLTESGFETMLETNGSLSIAAVPETVRRILDCKLPGSGMAESNLYDNYDLLTPRDEVKFVMSDRRDFDFALGIVRRHRLDQKGCPLLAGAVAGRLEPAELAGWILEQQAPFRLQIQLHKVLWGNRPGV